MSENDWRLIDGSGSDMSDNTRRFLMRRWEPHGNQSHADVIAAEEPLEILLSYAFKDTRRTESAAVTMRTPGNETELALGFLLSEGVIGSLGDVAEARSLGSGAANEILVELQPHVDVESWHLRRATLLTSACGLCGKRTWDSIPKCESEVNGESRISAETLYGLPSQLREWQQGFSATGGLHAAALVGADGAIKAVFEDIGRHNALDKLVGHCLQRREVPLSNGALLLSSRGSFELVQKAVAAGCGILATIGAPSSLAIEFATERSVTLIGFLRDRHFNVYSGDWRVVP
jgi:FdhD protein